MISRNGDIWIQGGEDTWRFSPQEEKMNHWEGKGGLLFSDGSPIYSWFPLGGITFDIEGNILLMEITCQSMVLYSIDAAR